MTDSMRMKTNIVCDFTGRCDIWTDAKRCDIWTDANAIKVLRHFDGIEEIYSGRGRHHFVARLDPIFAMSLLLEKIREALEAELEAQK